MQAMQFSAYGSPQQLKLTEAPMPAPAHGEVLIRVTATSVNPIDWKLLAGLLRWMKPLRFPVTPCFDFSGTVAAAGPGVSEWAAGDAVFGMLPMNLMGAAAEFVCVASPLACRAPAGLNLKTIAGLPLAGMTALQALRDKGRLKAGEEVMIIGAAGGVGHFALQIAALLGARVTAVCGSRNVEFCQNLGAATVLDYTRPDCSVPPAAFDLILDAAGHDHFSRWQPALKPEGRFVALLPSLSLGIAAMKQRLFTRQRVGITFVRPRRNDLAWLAEQVSEGKLRITVDQEFSLPQLPAAFEKSRAGHVRGKLIITVEDPTPA
jgi:NADPH:quinone reductase-like Zn-dependent oxidoreductase